MLKTRRRLIAGLCSCALLAGAVTPAHADIPNEFDKSLDILFFEALESGSSASGNDPDSPENQKARDEAYQENKRMHSVLHYGVTTQEDIDKCVAKYAGKPIVAMEFPYNYPCPLKPITERDIANAKRDQFAKRAFFAPVAVIVGVLSVLMLPINWLWDGIRGARENFLASS
ncbi:hypothetical protein [Corynebacterium aquilae]|uniref:Uncharacterized protein n=1 Tax=Corynebacterium aquilae DSM 44791 TaxID=1431546 RepID=A0A1L7CIG1_9CORY|nr:hypothetical protein [Corynebacterium aquilae]APT85652.1 hypothetical protein CAQU_12060 [Corynebacterium aquilae DSM 44791]